MRWWRARPTDAGRVRRHLLPVVAVGLGLVGFWALRLWTLNRSVETYGRYWSVPRGDPGGLVYVALGDSTAQGIGASRPERGYVGLIAERLRVSAGRPVQVVNLSRAGARLADVRAEQLPRLAGLRPDLVTVGVGANDVRHYDGARFEAEVDALLAALPATTVVADIPWFMHGDTGRSSGEAASAVARAASAKGLPVAHVHQAMRRRGWASMLTDFAPDWFHPNDRGHRVWADAFWRSMPTDPA